MNHNDIAKIIVDVAINLHKELGPGLFESAYEKFLIPELKDRGLDVRSQVPIPVAHKGVEVDTGFIADIIVNDKVIIELKSVENLNATHKKQLLTYLKLTDYKLGLLLNFGNALMKNGIRRIINGQL